MNISSSRAKEMAENYAKAWCSHNSISVAAFYAVDGRIVINDGYPSIGRSEISEMAQAFYDDFPDLFVKYG